jgi:hypothetical protein
MVFRCEDCDEEFKDPDTIYYCASCKSYVCEACRLDSHLKHRVMIRGPDEKWIRSTFDYEAARAETK